MNKIFNIAAYRFVTLTAEQLQNWRLIFKKQALLNELKGTILLSQEGVNLFLAGLPENIASFQNFLRQFPELSSLTYRESWSEDLPFKRLLVRLKKEIITMGQADIQPEKNSAPYINPQTLRTWFREQREMVVLDTRNQYEVERGAFNRSVHLNLKNFRGFPQAVAQLLPEAAKQLPIVTFCTGGIRCEKAALWLKKQGYPEVYQLQGGILNYFAECGDDYFHGKCFVFDERAAIDEQSVTSGDRFANAESTG